MMTELEFTRERAGTNNWIVARRTTRTLERYGEDVRCFSPSEYARVQEDYLRYRHESVVAKLKSSQELYRQDVARWRDKAAKTPEAGSYREFCEHRAMKAQELVDCLDVEIAAMGLPNIRVA